MEINKQTNGLVPELLACKLAIFDLDGVIVDTAHYHFLAWQQMAESIGLNFTKQDNERLKGVSRSRSLDIILEINNTQLTAQKKEELQEQKNNRYIQYIKTIQPQDILPGAKELLVYLRSVGIKTAIGSASKNAPMVLDGLGITHLFDEIVDGNTTQRAKPDPAVFTISADRLKIPYNQCIVFEDAQAGIDAALAAKMTAVAIGDSTILQGAKYYLTTLAQIKL
ncbi:MAG: beta-phosphoglucomutase [Defluviitaleaceae bacterium]|nr:beta-phosphoglucomutase [Defluviitaleaceae bacterium]